MRIRLTKLLLAITVLTLAFTSGLVRQTEHHRNPECELVQQHESTPVVTIRPEEPATDGFSKIGKIDFGRRRPIVVTRKIRLKSDRLRYDVNVRYPKIIGTDDPSLDELNRGIEKLVTEQYDHYLDPSEEDLIYYCENWPEVFNSVEVEYEVLSTTNSFVSLYLNVRDAGIGSISSFQNSFVINYHFKLGRLMSMSDVFIRDSKYLEFVSRFCIEDLRRRSESVIAGELAARPETFQSWNITSKGIRFNFDKCAVLSCAEGKQHVQIPYADLKPYLNQELMGSLNRADAKSLATRKRSLN